MKLLIIYNPNAGGGHAAKVLPQIKQYISELGIEADYQLTKHIGHGVDIAKEAGLNNYDGLIASGGDGTLSEVVNGFYLNQSKNKPPVGIIPNGTGNAFCKDMGLIPSDWKKSIDIIKAKNVKKIDVAKYKSQGKTQYFVNIIGTCFVVDIAKRSVFWKFLGERAYTLAVLLELVRLKSTKITMVVDGEKMQRDCTFIEVSNTRYTGTTFIMAPNAKLDDGLLDVTIANKITRYRLLVLLKTIFTGDHIHEPEVETFRVKNISIETEIPYELLPDGEIKDKTPVEIECIKQDLPLFWDAGYQQD